MKEEEEEEKKKDGLGETNSDTHVMVIQADSLA